MQDTPKVQGGQIGLWRRLARVGLWPLLLAEACFLLICLSAGLMVWSDIDDRLQQEQRQELLRAQRLQASLIDQQLARQQQHLRQLGRATRRVLQSDVLPTSPDSVDFAPSPDGRLWLFSSEGMAMFGEAAALPGGQRLGLARRLNSLEPLMNDLYFSDGLIERLHISLPQGLSAIMPGAEVLAEGADPALDRYRFEAAGPGMSALRWRTRSAGDDDPVLALRFDVYDDRATLLAQVGLELDSTRLNQRLQDIADVDSRAWLVNDRGESLLGAAERILPDEAGRRGIGYLDIAEEQPGLQVWAPLSTTGWRLVSHLPMPEAAGVKAALGWISLGWGVGSLLILIVILMVFHHQVQRWEHELIVPGTRLARLRQRLAALVPAWLCPPFAGPGGASSRKGNPLSAHIDAELDALEAMQTVLADQPQLVTLIERLDRPALLTHDGQIVAVNLAFEQFVGRPRSELLGLSRESLLVDGEAGSSTVRVRDARGRWQLLRRAGSEDGRGHALSVLIDDSESRYRAQQLSLARDHAREESSLKTRYMALLRREIEALLLELESDGASVDPGLRERLTGLLELLDNLNGGVEREMR